MVFSGVFSNGVVILNDDARFPDGTAVEVIVKQQVRNNEESTEPTLGGLLAVAGAADGLPADFAEQHDHYIHGTPKR